MKKSEIRISNIETPFGGGKPPFGWGKPPFGRGRQRDKATKATKYIKGIK